MHRVAHTGLRIAVASGKGGTGKTTIATNLAFALAESGIKTAYVDCDVEEPNGHIFLKPVIEKRTDVSVNVPEVDRTRCSLCGACGKACRFSAITVLPKEVMTFPKLCHSCGGCFLACSEGAIREVPRVTGAIEEGSAGQVRFFQGRLSVGEAMAPPVIRALLNTIPTDGAIVIDAPPGTSCPVIESIKPADVVLLVTEPTPFGLNDLKLAVEMVRSLGLPLGVAVNRIGTGSNDVFDYCTAERLPVLLEIPNNRAVAHAYSRGELALTAQPDLKPLLRDLFQRLSDLAKSVSTPARRGRATVESTPNEEPTTYPSAALKLGRRHDVRELVVISGKGGTGKTSIVASLCALADKVTAVDCDVDAADLHLVLAPDVLHRWTFSGGETAIVDSMRCIRCWECAESCRFDAIQFSERGRTYAPEVDPLSCEGCGVCADHCWENAISLASLPNGEWFVSSMKYGPMVHARLGIAQENSGKLVSLVRREAKELSMTHRRDLLICDGSPGIGCPVIASISGASLVLIVTEPTLSGIHDLKRVMELCQQFNVKTGICINKTDINLDVSAQIEQEARTQKVPILGRIRYDESVTAAQVGHMAVVENGGSSAAADIRELWGNVSAMLA